MTGLTKPTTHKPSNTPAADLPSDAALLYEMTVMVVQGTPGDYTAVSYKFAQHVPYGSLEPGKVGYVRAG